MTAQSRVGGVPGGGRGDQAGPRVTRAEQPGVGPIRSIGSTVERLVPSRFRVRGRRGRNGQRDREELRRAVEDDPEAAELVGRALEAAVRTASEDKRHLLAQVATAALTGNAAAEIDHYSFCSGR